MSKENVKKMIGKMAKDAGLQKKYAEIMQEHQKEAEKALTDKLVEFGGASGFAFSKADLLAARAELIEKANENKELVDTDLSSVAGGGPGDSGKVYGALLSVLTVGVGCLVVSTIEDSKVSGGCKAKLT